MLSGGHIIGYTICIYYLLYISIVKVKELLNQRTKIITVPIPRITVTEWDRAYTEFLTEEASKSYGLLKGSLSCFFVFFLLMKWHCESSWGPFFIHPV